MVVEVVELTRKLVEINSENPPGNEKEVAFFIKDFLEDLKLDAKLMKFGDKRFNLITSIGKKKDGLMLNGHMDTVPIGKREKWKFNPFGEVKGNRLYGRGSVDMKGGLACILIALKNLIRKRKEFKRKLLLAFVGDEEVALSGSRFLIEKKKNILSGIKYGVIAEPTNFQITIAQKGIADFRVKFKGKAAHGSKPELGENAIYKACDFIAELRKLMRKLKRKRHPLLGSGSINVGKIMGGIKVNIVPDFCEIEIDRRIIPGESGKTVKKELENILKKLRIKAEIELLISRLPLEIPKDSLLVKLLQSITRSKIRGESGYTEAELYYRECGIECVVCGPGDMDLAHMTNEYITVQQLKKGVKVYQTLIDKLCC